MSPLRCFVLMLGLLGALTFLPPTARADDDPDEILKIDGPEQPPTPDHLYDGLYPPPPTPAPTAPEAPPPSPAPRQTFELPNFRTVLDPETSAAIAYSPSTGWYAYSWVLPGPGDASNVALYEQIALRKLDEEAGREVADNQIVASVQCGFAVLVIAEDNAYGAGTSTVGETRQDAIDRAMNNLRKRSNAKVTTLVVVCSDGINKPLEYKY